MADIHTNPTPSPPPAPCKDANEPDTATHVVGFLLALAILAFVSLGLLL